MKNTKIHTYYTFKITTAYDECVFAACVTSYPEIGKLYSLHWALIGM